MEAGIDLQMETDKVRNSHCCEATIKRQLMIRHGCWWDPWAEQTWHQRMILRAKLNKNLVKDTRVAVSASKWTQHILCQGHSFCFWHFGFLEVESLQFLRKFTFGIHHVYGLHSLFKDRKWCCLQWQSFDNCYLGVAVGQQQKPWLWQLYQWLYFGGILPALEQILLAYRISRKIKKKSYRKRNQKVWGWMLILHKIWVSGNFVFFN